MRMLSLSSLLLVSGILGLAQDSQDLVDKAPAPVEQALRARIDQYYHAFMAGKYKDAYVLVAEDSQDAFLEADKQQYKACETVRIRYSENFTKAVVVESCNSEWKWHGIVTPTTFPTTSNWELSDGKWFWHYVKPTQIASPFSPTGFIAAPATDATPKKDAPPIPADMNGAAKNILAMVTVDKQSVHLLRDQTSQDVIHVRNGMPGQISLKLETAANNPGLKVTVGKSQLQAHEETTILFEWRPDDLPPSCPTCPRRVPNTRAQLQVLPTGQAFPINIAFDGTPAAPPPANH